MAGIGFPVSLRGYDFENWQLTVNLKAGIVAADAGKAVTIDTSASVHPTFKLAGDGDPVMGRLKTVEDRVQEGLLLGTVQFKFGNTLPIKSGLSGANAVVVGSSVVGAGNGEVKARTVSSAATPDYNDNFVSELTTVRGVAHAVVLKL